MARHSGSKAQRGHRATIAGADAQARSDRTGAVVTETIFAWPGLGRVLVAAAGQRDLPVIQAGILLVALTAVEEAGFFARLWDSLVLFFTGIFG